MQACGDSGVTVQPRTEGGRDALLRTGVEAAASAAMSHGAAARLGTAAPGALWLAWPATWVWALVKAGWIDRHSLDIYDTQPFEVASWEGSELYGSGCYTSSH